MKKKIKIIRPHCPNCGTPLNIKMTPWNQFDARTGKELIIPTAHCKFPCWSDWIVYKGTIYTGAWEKVAKY
jgi:hypothetical protein